ncbi:MAG: 50S ribosomal protein L15 [Gammaproteobacteria bacterium]
MRLNTLKPGPGARRAGKRLGRGVGSGSDKTCGRGHKGQSSRAGGGSAKGFEGGQMPLQRRLPKYGFRSRKAKTRGEVRLDALARLVVEAGGVIDLEAIKASKLVDQPVCRVKVIASGSLDRPVALRGLAVTRGARAIIEAAGGRIED